MSIKSFTATHRANLQIQTRLYSTRTSLQPTEDAFLVKADTGASCKVRCTSSSVNLKGTDESGKSLSLTFKISGDQLVGTLQIGRRRIRAQAKKNEIWKILYRQYKAIPGIEKLMPSGKALEPLAKEMRNNPSLIFFLIGRPKTKVAGRKGFCEAVCDCCAEGRGPVAIWCCYACWYCDIFKMNLTSTINELARA
jgi:hypothetical protein